MKTALLAAAVAVLVPAAAFAQSDDAGAAAAEAHYTLDTPIKVLIADPVAKAVLDKDLPGMSSDENLPKFEDKSLRQLQPMTGGQLTDAMLKQVAADLGAPDSASPAAAQGPVLPPATDAPPASSKSIPEGR